MHGVLVVAHSGKNSILNTRRIITASSCDTLAISFGDFWRTRNGSFIISSSKFTPTPAILADLVTSTLSATIIDISYGIDVQPEDDPNVERAGKALVNLKEAAISGSFMVDILPFLKYMPTWMPGAGFKAYAERVRPYTVDMREAPYKEGTSRLVSALSAASSFICS